MVRNTSIARGSQSTDIGGRIDSASDYVALAHEIGPVMRRIHAFPDVVELVNQTDSDVTAALNLIGPAIRRHGNSVRLGRKYGTPRDTKAILRNP